MIPAVASARDRWSDRDVEVSREIAAAGAVPPTRPRSLADYDVAEWHGARAAILLIGGDLPEALTEAEAALRNPEARLPTRARALQARGTAAVLMDGRVAGITDLRQSLDLLSTAGATGTRLHHGILSNLASSLFRLGDADASEVYEELASVRSFVAATDPEWATQTECLEAYNDVLKRSTSMTESDLVKHMSEVARRCARAGVTRVEGLARATAGEVLGRSEQYTAALFFLLKAEKAFLRDGFDALAFGARVQSASIYQQLGMSVSQALNQILHYEGNRTSLLLEKARAHSVFAEHHAFLGDNDSANEAYRVANQLGLLLRARGMLLPALGDRVAIAMGGLYRARLTGADPHPWVKSFEALFEDCEAPLVGKQMQKLLSVAISMVTMDEEQVSKQLRELADEPPGRFPLPTEALLSFENLATSFSRSPGLQNDLDEFASHVRHLVGEQEETVRVAYRNANLLPVLNRILRNRGDEVDSWTQFRLVEYSRWGSLPPRDQIRVGADIKSVSAAALEAEDLRFPTSLHFEGLDGDLSAGASHLTTNQFLKVAEGALLGCKWLLQMYLAGRQLAWAAVETTSGRLLSGRHLLERHTLQNLRFASYWIAPNPGQSEGAFLADNNLDGKYATTLAAARVANGVFVQDRALARDFILGLPRSCQQEAGNWLQTGDSYDFDAICQSLGTIFDGLPQELWLDESPLALSLGGDFRGVPLTLAWQGGQPLGCRRPLVTLPPLSVLHYGTNIGHALESSQPWKLVRLGNVAAASGFAPRSETSDVLNALTNSPTGRQTVLYSGHIARGPSGRASSAGIPLGGDAFLTAADILRMKGIRVPTRVGIVGCEAAGWNLSDEWGGLSAALLLRGTKEVAASDWTILDTHSTAQFDSAIASILTGEEPLETALWQLTQRKYEEWRKDRAALPPQIWASMRVMRR